MELAQSRDDAPGEDTHTYEIVQYVYEMMHTAPASVVLSPHEDDLT